MNIIETKKLTKYYLRGKVLGIKDLNLEIKEGEIFGFIGPNGAGKSTTIRLLLDLIRPTSGSIAIFDLDAHTDTVQIKKNVGYLPGEIFLTESMTGKETLAYYQGFKKEIDRDYVNHLVKKLGLDLSKKVGDYSKGNKQKLGIVLAIMHKPKLLILDEPTDGFSTEQLDKVRDVLDQLNMKQVVIVSHESKIESFVENVIRVQKNDNVSMVL